jgi:uncharacterized protein
VSERLLVWRGLEEWRAESALVQVGDGHLSATGTQLGVEPEPYRLDYELETGADWVTQRLSLQAHGEGWERSLELIREPDGRWSANGEARADLGDALDCDLAYSPLTNAMPVFRHGMRETGARAADLVMAWVDVPALTVHRSEQRYEPVDARSVRFVSPGDGFQVELELDGDGLVVRYPQLAERVVAAG